MLLNMTGVPRLVLGLMADRRVPLGLKLILPAALAYIISPIDLVPDMLPVLFPVLGRIDDVLVAVLSLALFLSMAPKEVVWEHLHGGKGRSPQSGASEPGTVIEGSYRVVDEDEK